MMSTSSEGIVRTCYNSGDSETLSDTKAFEDAVCSILMCQSMVPSAWGYLERSVGAETINVRLTYCFYSECLLVMFMAPCCCRSRSSDSIVMASVYHVGQTVESLAGARQTAFSSSGSMASGLTSTSIHYTVMGLLLTKMERATTGQI